MRSSSSSRSQVSATRWNNSSSAIRLVLLLLSTCCFLVCAASTPHSLGHRASVLPALSSSSSRSGINKNKKRTSYSKRISIKHMLLFALPSLPPLVIIICQPMSQLMILLATHLYLNRSLIIISLSLLISTALLSIYLIEK